MTEFVGDIKTEWLSDGESMRLLSNCGFIDSKGVHWQAMKGDLVNGASIPRFFWRVVGSPFRGLYRDASVFHDVACDKKLHTSNQAHKMFHEAILLTIEKKDFKPIKKKIELFRAKLMYLAVYNFGPQWK